MRERLQVLIDELQRCRREGVGSAAVSEEAMRALRSAVTAQVAQEASLPGPAVSAPPFPAAPVAAAPAAGTRSVRRGTTAPVPPAEAPPLRRVAAPPAHPPAPAPASPSALPPPPEVRLPDGGTKRERWERLRDFVLNHPVCRAHAHPGCKVVFGVGSIDAAIMFVGEAPGAEEEQQGEPFVGRAGELLTKMIGAMGLRREDVYIGNIMNWRPEMERGPGGVQVGNRPPTAEEMAFCLPFLRAQVEVVRPGLLVALGATAAKGLLGMEKVPSLGAIKGQWHEFNGIPLMVTYHPSYILRNNSNRSKRSIWEDLLKVMERAQMPVSGRQRGYFLDK